MDRTDIGAAKWIIITGFKFNYQLPARAQKEIKRYYSNLSLIS